MNARAGAVMSGVLVLAVVALYLWRLDWSPVYLVNDEVFGALQTLSLAETGRSIGGDFLPVYFRGLEFPPGRDPLSIYVTAAFVKLLPVSEGALRLPTALLGLANVGLAYLLGLRMFGQHRFALLTAALLAATPAHFIHSRIAIPTLWSVPWLLGWLIGLADYSTRRRPGSLFASMLCLGAAVYGYFGTALIVPLYLAGTMAFLYFSLRERTPRPYVVLLSGMAVSLVFIAYWHVLHPERWNELLDYYATSSAVMRPGTPLLQGSALPNFAAVQERVTTYWNFFDPSFLFLGGDDSLRYSTGRVGVFLLPVTVLLPVGIYQAAHAGGLGTLLIYCFLVTPLAGALGGEVQIQRALPLVLCGSLLASWGAVWLLSQTSVRLRRAGMVLCLFAGLQFVMFGVDYFGNYRLRSGASRGGNLRGAFEEAIAVSKEREMPALYLSENIRNIKEYWRLYAVILEAGELATRVRFVQPLHPTEDPPPGAFMISEALPGRELEALKTWRLRHLVYELDGTFFYAVYDNVR